MSGKKNRTVVITGTSSGIGLSSSEFMAKKGWTVFAGVRKQADADRLKELHENIHPIIIDVTKEDEIAKAFEEVGKIVGSEGLDALVNNAGGGLFGPVEFTPIADVQRQFDLNVFGVLRVTQAAMPLLRMGKPGRVVIIGSTAGQMNFPYGGLYCATKAAIDSISEVFRREVARWGIKVSLIKPGPVKTNFDKAGLQQAQEIQEKFPAGSPCHDFYGKDLDNFPKAIENFAKQSADVSKVTGVVHTALTARNPKNIYYDTYGTYYTMGMLARLPTGTVDSQLGNMIFAKK